MVVMIIIIADNCGIIPETARGIIQLELGLLVMMMTMLLLMMVTTMAMLLTMAVIVLTLTTLRPPTPILTLPKI